MNIIAIAKYLRRLGSGYEITSRLLITAGGIALGLFVSSPAQAELLTFTATGPVTAIYEYNESLLSYFPKGVSVGDPYSFSYTFDTATPNVSESYGYYANAVTSASVTIGANSPYQIPRSTYSVAGHISVFSDAYEAGYGASGFPGSGGSGYIYMLSVPEYFSSYAIPVAPPDASKFHLTDFGFSVGSFAAVTGTVSNIAASSPPTTCVPPQVLQGNACVTPQPPTCVPPQVLQGNSCVTPTPTAFGPVDVPLPHTIDGIVNARGYTLSFQDGVFLVDFPIFLDTTLNRQDVQPLLDSWMKAINYIWSTYATDQYNEKYPFKFNARIEDKDKNLSFSTLHLDGLIASDDPPCRVSPGLLDVFSPCLFPQVNDSGVLLMYSGAQHFCYSTFLGVSLVRSCDQTDVAAFAKYNFPLMHCKNPDGSDMVTLMCLDSGGWQTYVAAHEFGHLLGLPDEYPEGGGDSAMFGFCQYISASDPRHGCKPGYNVGIMGSLTAPVQPRYFDYLFDSLNDITKGFSWTFGGSPFLIDDYPFDPLLATMAFELPPGSVASIPEPSTLALVGLILAGLAFTKRKGYFSESIYAHRLRQKT